MTAPRGFLGKSGLVGRTLPEFAVSPILKAGLLEEVALGRLPPKKDFKPKLKLKNYVKGSLPPMPITWWQKALNVLSKMFLNDRLGCCTIADAGHSEGVVTANELGTAVIATDTEIEKIYRIWNPGTQDDGCVIEDVLNYQYKNGFVFAGQSRKLTGFVQVDHTDWTEVIIALWLAGTIRLGINFPEAWFENDIWDLVNSSNAGGHDVPIIGALTDPTHGPVVRIASWARTYDITERALVDKEFVEEAWMPLNAEWYAKARMAPNLIDADTLLKDLNEIGQGHIPDIGPPSPPVPPAPPPPPTPHVSPWQVMLQATGDVSTALQQRGWSFVRAYSKAVSFMGFMYQEAVNHVPEAQIVQDVLKRIK